MLCCWRFPGTIELNKIHVFYSCLSSNLVAYIILYLHVWSLAVFLQSLVFSVYQSNLSSVRTSVCQNTKFDTPMIQKETPGVARRVALPRPSLAQPASTPSTSKHSESTDPSVPEGYVLLAGDEVVIKKAVLQGIKRGAELALKGQAPTSFCLGQATAGDLPFEVPAPAPHQVHCDICRKDLPTPKALRHHLQAHKGMTHYLCPKCGKHLASGRTWDMHKESCGSTEFAHNC